MDKAHADTRSTHLCPDLHSAVYITVEPYKFTNSCSLPESCFCRLSLSWAPQEY